MNEWFQNADWLSFAGAILGGLIGGLFTFFGVRKTLKHEDKRARKEKLEREFETRPRLEIQSFKDFGQASIDSPCDLACVFLKPRNIIEEEGGRLSFEYDQRALDDKELCCVEYVFKNIGKTEIEGFCITSNFPRLFSAIELRRRDFLLNNKLVFNEAWSDKRFIKPGETISIKVCYLGDEVFQPATSSTSSIHLTDVNGNVWRQPFFCPTEEPSDSRREEYKDFVNLRDSALIERHFNDPAFW